MGWCSGSYIYDPVAKAILDEPISDLVKEYLLIRLIEALRSQDWDCEELATNNPIELEVFKSLGIWRDEEEE